MKKNEITKIIDLLEGLNIKELKMIAKFIEGIKK